VCVDVGGVSQGFESLSQTCYCISVNLYAWNKTKKWNLILGDGRFLPLRTNSADVCISNSVIEHLGCGEDRFADELQRVSNGAYFVSVPYYYTIFEPHYLVPFFQFVPKSIKTFLIVNLGLKIGWVTKKSYRQIGLLMKNDLKSLFPRAFVKVFRFCGMPTDIIAMQPRTTYRDFM